MGKQIQDAWNDALGIITLNMKVVKRTSKKGYGNSVIIFAIVAIVHALATGLWWGNGNVIATLVNTFVSMLIGSFVWFWILWKAAQWFGGKADFAHHYKPLADSLLLHALLPIPFIGFLAVLWGVIVRIRAVAELHGLTNGKAAAAVLVPLAIIVVFALTLESKNIAYVSLISRYVLPGLLA